MFLGKIYREVSGTLERTAQADRRRGRALANKPREKAVGGGEIRKIRKVSAAAHGHIYVPGIRPVQLGEEKASSGSLSVCILDRVLAPALVTSSNTKPSRWC